MVTSTFTTLNADLQTPERFVQQKNRKVKKRPITNPSQKRQNKTTAKKGKHLKIQLRRGEKNKEAYHIQRALFSTQLAVMEINHCILKCSGRRIISDRTAL
jgi:hypothetical protein